MEEESLRTHLANWPITSLIPTQDIAPFVSSVELDIPQENPLKYLTDETEYSELKSAIEENPKEFESVIDKIATDFISFQDDELNDIHFKTKKVDNEDYLDIDLTPMERKIFQNQNNQLQAVLNNDDGNSNIALQPSQLPEMENVHKIRKLTMTNANDHEFEYEYEDDDKDEFDNDVKGVKRKCIDKSLTNFHTKKSFLNTEASKIESSELFRLYIDQTEHEIDSEIWSETPKGGRILSTLWLVNLSDLLQRNINNSTLQEFDFEYLQRFNSLCFANVSEALEETWSSFQQLDAVPTALVNIAFNSLLACKAILKVLSQRKERQLFVNEHIKAIVDFIYILVDEVIIPIGTKNSVKVSLDKNLLSALISEVCSTLQLMVNFIENNIIDDQLLTRLEYLAIYAIYANFDLKEKTSVFTASAIDDLKFSASSILCLVFKNHPEQRNFILEEILSRFPDLNNNKQLKLYRGVCVMSVSGLILNLIQTFDVLSCSSTAGQCLELEASLDTSSTSKQAQLNSDINKIYSNAKKITEEIATILYSDLLENPDQAHKSSIESLIEDLLLVLPFPEWPSSELLLSSILHKFLKEAKNPKDSLIESYMLEFCGVIGIKIFNMKQNCNITFKEESFDSIYKTAIQVLEYSYIQAKKNPFFAPSFKFLLLKYLNQLTTSAEFNDISEIPEKFKSIYFSLLDILSNGTMPLSLIVDSTIDSKSKVYYLEVLIRQSLFNQLEDFMDFVIQSLTSSKVKIRSRSIKILSSLIEIDSNLLTTTKIKDSITSMISDESPLVRDSVIDLVSNYMSINNTVIKHFYQPICLCMNDKSISVRKRVIKIGKDMYNDSKDIKIKIHIAEYYLNRILLEEDPSMLELVQSILLDIWFFNKEELTLPILAELSNNPKYWKCLVTFFKNVVIKRSKNSLRNLLQQSLDNTLDSKDDSEKYLNFAYCIVECDGSIMSQDQLSMIIPLLQDDEVDVHIHIYTLNIMKNVLSNSKALRNDFILSMESLLLQRLTKFNSKELQEAMICLSILTRLSGNTKKIVNACIVCLQHIRPYIAKIREGNGKTIADGKLKRLLDLLGNFGSFGSFEVHRDLFQKSKVGLKDGETITSLLTKILLFFFTNNTNESVKLVALKNILAICSGHATLFMSDTILKLLDNEFSLNDNMMAKIVIVKGFITFLESEDKNTSESGIDEVKSSKEVKIDHAIFHGLKNKSFVNDSICGSIIQRYSPKIAQLCFYDEGELSIFPIKYLQLVINLGFANPKLLIPSIIALQSSKNRYIKNIAEELHTKLFDKYESLVDGNYYEALKIATDYRNKLGSIKKERFFLRSVYETISYSRPSRKKFITAISQAFSLILYEDEKAIKDAEKQRDILIFTAVNVSTINFKALEDLFFLLQVMNSSIRMESEDLADEIREFQKNDYGNGKILFVLAQTVITLIGIRQFLSSIYNVNESMVDMFNPSKVDQQLKQIPKMVRMENFLLDSSVYEQSENEITMARVFKKFFEKMAEFES